jgi:hypothetical protein
MTKFLDFYHKLDRTFTDSEKRANLPTVGNFLEIIRRARLDSKHTDYQTFEQATNREEEPFLKTVLNLIIGRPIYLTADDMETYRERLVGRKSPIYTGDRSSEHASPSTR